MRSAIVWAVVFVIIRAADRLTDGLSRLRRGVPALPLRRAF